MFSSEGGTEQGNGFASAIRIQNWQPIRSLTNFQMTMILAEERRRGDRTGPIVKRLLRKIVVPLSILILLIATQAVEAEPFEDFFRALRHTITHPEQKPRSHRSGPKQNKGAVSSDASSHMSSGSAVTAPPNGHNTRTAKAASRAKEGKSGLRYGTPVPGKQGLVTSPFAPDNGYIDVRGFPPGTKVKDPYTGKIFLTP